MIKKIKYAIKIVLLDNQLKKIRDALEVKDQKTVSGSA